MTTASRSGVEQRIRTGDTVFHRPSKETWVVAYATDKHVCPCGWPETLADIGDCELLRSCSDEHNEDMLRILATKRDGDTRQACARAELERRKQ